MRGQAEFNHQGKGSHYLVCWGEERAPALRDGRTPQSRQNDSCGDQAHT